MFVGEKVVGTFFAAVLEANLLQRQGMKSNSKPLQVGITVNVYGPRSSMDEVDQAVSKIEVYLQHPVFLEPDVSYINPQYYYPSPKKTDLRHLVGPVRENIASNRSRDIENVMDHLETSKDISSQGCSIVGLSETLGHFLPRTQLKEYGLYIRLLDSIYITDHKSQASDSRCGVYPRTRRRCFNDASP
jgi:hypothetical protein